jgi:hypothetical protein
MFKINRSVGAVAGAGGGAGADVDADDYADASFLCVAGAGMQFIRVGP